MRWFVEEAALGDWHPVIYHGERPTSKRTWHSVRFRRDPELVPDFMHDLTLDQVAQLMSPDGEFYGYDEQTQRAVADFIRDPEKTMMIIADEDLRHG